ncbi:MAG TPA: PEP-CTERM sorting domain-containing protein [Opitutaceae bacterium]|nr:PEP-CTERM sorting domain-containing protein [Opitutaceae bacterium]
MKTRLQLSTLLLAAVALVPVVQAQVTITSVTYGTMVDGANTNNQGNNNLDFQNQYTPVLQVGTGIGAYRFDGPTATSIVTRRNTGVGNSNNTTIFYQYDGSNNEIGEYENSIQNSFLSSNLTEGLRNPFANGNNSDETNIERIDFYLPNYVVRATDALVFFDLENTGNFGDGFRIAAFSALGTVNGFANAPSTYVNSGLLVAADSFGPAVNSPTGGTNGNFERVTYTNGDDLSGTVANGNIVDIGNGLNLVGIMIRLSDLGVTAGTTIQGFSLMGGDVVAANAAQLVNWNSTTNYLTNTSAAGVGNMDFMSFGATVARPVPEPSTYGMILVGAALAAWMWRKRKLAAPVAA